MPWLQGLVEEFRKKSEMVDLFGVVLYTNEHAHIVKVLRDEDYWSSFDDISGRNFAVFSIRPKKGHIESPKFRSGIQGLMYAVWEEPNENLPILSEFCIENTSKLPLFIVFTHIDGEIAKLEFRLKDTSQEEAYASFKTALTIVRSALDQIKKENTKNAPGVFAAVAQAYDGYKTFEFVKKGINFYTWVKGLMP